LDVGLTTPSRKIYCYEISGASGGGSWRRRVVAPGKKKKNLRIN
jgi:hypothetical protein